MSNTYPTMQFPLGSAEVKVLYNNASNFDDAMNAEDPRWTDRFGLLRQSWSGMEAMVQDFLLAMGFEATHLQYVDGTPLTVLRPTQLIDRAGFIYKVKQPASFPVNLTGTWATDSLLLVDVGNASLGADLQSSAKDKGISIVFGGVRYVNSVAELRTVLKTTLSVVTSTLGYYSARDGGGGVSYSYDASDTTSADNGGSIIVALDGGRWKTASGVKLNLRQWGCKGDGATDDTARFLACVGFGASFHVPDGTFMVGPVGPAAVPPYPSVPFPPEPNRTSASVLSSGQCVTGNGPRSILSWNNATKQAFFYMKDAVNCDISDVSFVGGYSALILDPTANGSVENCGLTRCYMDGQLVGMIGGRQLALDPTGSRSCIRPYAIDCKYKNILVHGVVMTNCQRPYVNGGDFKDCTAGFCVDFSQGTRGGIISNLNGNNVLHGVKVESSNVSGGTDTTLASERCILTQLNISNISGIAVLINSANDRILISDSIFHGTNADTSAALISLDSVTGFVSNGQCVLSNVIATATLGGCLLNGITSGTLPTIIDGCSFVGVSFGVNNRAPRLQLSDSNILVSTSTGNCINTGISNLNNLDQFSMRNCVLTGLNGLVEQGTSTAWRHVNLTDNTFNVSTFAAFSAAAGGTVGFKFSDNKVNRATATSAAPVTLPVTASAMITDNMFNLNTASSPAAVVVATGMSKSRLSGNISTCGFSIASPDASTTTNTNNNIIDAAYAA